MFVKCNFMILGTNPFLDAYIHSDFLGKFIFISLILLSLIAWVVLLQKIIITRKSKKNSIQFYRAFQLQKKNCLGLESENILSQPKPNPFLDIYNVLKKHTLDILNKNRHFAKKGEASYLSPSDIDFVESHLITTVAYQTKNLQKNLFILATIVTLAPFLGLLGTVWGILTTFSDLHAHSAGSTHDLVLGGLSLALATTVLGLLDAIPALIGYNYLKNAINDFEIEMEGFANEVLATVEFQYRKVDVE